MVDDSKRGMAVKAGVLAVALVVVVSMAAGAGLSPGANANAQAEMDASASDSGTNVSSQADTASATEIDSCTVIDQPGRYTLTKDLENVTATEDAGIATDLGNVSACIVIDSSDVVFDGTGHTIDGKGVASPENSTAVEQNATLNESREIFPTGVSAVSQGEDLTNVTVRDVTATDWFLGVLYTNVTDSAIRDTTASDNANLGIEVLGGATSTRVTAANNTANGNGFAGIYLGGADDNTLVNNTAADNGLIGIDLFVSNHNSLAGNRLDDNEVAGVGVVDSTGNDLAENVIANTGGNNSFVGFSGGLALLNATDTRVEDTVATGNEEWDFYALNASATATNYTLDSATVSFETKNGALDAVESPPADPENRTGIGQYVNATNTSDDSFLDLNVSYEDTDVEQAGVNESTLRLFEYNGDWSQLASSSVDTDANTVSANISDFPVENGTIYAPFGQSAAGDTTNATEIDSCTVIDEPGRYVLTEDIENSTTDQCIRIEAPNVTLDGAGHTVDGVDDFPTGGIVVFGFIGANDVTVTNVTVTDWGAGIGYESTTGEIRDSVVASNSRGIAFTFGTAGVAVADNTITANDQGIYLQSSGDNTFTNTTARGNEQVYYSDSDPQEGPSINNTVANLELDSATISFESKDVGISAVDSPPADPDNRTNIHQYVDATNTSADSFLDIDVSYEDADTEVAGVDESTLRLFEFENGNWSEVSGSSVDTDTNVVSGNVTDFSGESVLAPLGKTTEAPTEHSKKSTPPAEEPAGPQQPEPGVTYYQVDFVRGEPIQHLDWPDGTYTNDQLIRFAHGSTETPITRRSDGEFTTDTELAERIDSRNITVENDTARVRFTVTEGDPVTLTLASYTKPDPIWDPEDEDDQVFVDSETRTFETGTHTLTVSLPDGETNGNDTGLAPSASTITRNALQAYDSIDDLSLTERTTYTIRGEAPYAGNNGTETYTQRVFAKRPNEVRYDTLAPPEYAGDIYVSNGSHTVYYNATANAYEVYDGDAGDYIEYLGDLLREVTYEYAGTKTVDGHETYVLINSSGDSDYPSGRFELTVYLDQETYLPVKTTAVDTALGGENSWVYTVRYENASVDTGLPDSTFEFDPPAGAERIDYSDFNDSYSEYDSVETAQRNVEFTIRAPTELPEGYELKNVSVYTYENTTSLENESDIQIFYTDGSDVLSAYMYPLPEGSSFYGFGERVPINTHIGYFESYEGLGSVNFECAGLDYYVDGSLDMSELVAVAESVDCDAGNGTATAGE